MVDLHSILAEHQALGPSHEQAADNSDIKSPTLSSIPDILFDSVLKDYKLSRVEIIVLMYLYRRVWCQANLFKVHGISQILSHTEMSGKLKLEIDEIYQAIRTLEEFNFISTIRSGQYFVRKYFTSEFDDLYKQTYDNFDI